MHIPAPPLVILQQWAAGGGALAGTGGAAFFSFHFFWTGGVELQSSNRCYKPTASGAADTRKKLQISRKVHSEWYNKLKASVKFSLIQLGSSQPSPAGVHLGSEFLVVFMIYKGLEAQSQKCLLTSTKPPSLRCLDIYQLRKELYLPYCSTIGPQARQDKAANLWDFSLIPCHSNATQGNFNRTTHVMHITHETHATSKCNNQTERVTENQPN